MKASNVILGVATCAQVALTNSDVDALSYQHTQTCCGALQKQLGNQVAFPDKGADSAYARSIASYWSLVEQDVKPSCIVQPRDRHHVARAVKILADTHLGPSKKCEFAVRGGGHTPYAGAANINRGVTIDLSLLNATTLTQDKKLVNIGPGARWVDVYTSLAPHNLGTSGGRVSPVGVGGLTTGGGISFFSPRYGFVCDNVVNFEVATADGSLINANAHEHPDLWRALRGGSNNFGVVTSFDMRTFPQGNFWGGNIGYPVEARHNLFQAFAAINANYTDPYVSAIHSYTITQKSPTWFITTTIIYTKSDPPVVNPPVWHSFTSEPNQLFNTMRVSNITDFSEELFADNSYGFRQSFTTGTFKNSARMMEEAFQIANQTAQQLLPKVPGLSFSISYQPLPEIILSKAKGLGGNVLGLSPAAGNLVNLLLTTSYNRAQDDSVVEAATRVMFARLEARAASLGLYHPFLYLNYAAKWQKPISGYGAESIASMHAVSRKYDPDQVFQKQVPGGFKLPYKRSQ